MSNQNEASQELITIQLSPEALGAALAAVQAGYQKVKGVGGIEAFNLRQWLASAEAVMADAGRKYSRDQREKHDAKR